MYIVPFTSESGDHYIIGPFVNMPTHDEVMAIFRASHADEAAYVQEMLDDRSLQNPFVAYALPDAEQPWTIDFQMSFGKRLQTS